MSRLNPEAEPFQPKARKQGKGKTDEVNVEVGNGSPAVRNEGYGNSNINGNKNEIGTSEITNLGPSYVILDHGKGEATDGNGNVWTGELGSEAFINHNDIRDLGIQKIDGRLVRKFETLHTW